MEILTILGSCASIIGMIISIFVLSQINHIKNDIKVKGDSNIIAGRDVNSKENDE